LLGPVRAWRGGEELDLGSPQQRAVLAVLLMREGRPASADALVDAVWGDEPPRTAVLTLRTYVFRLRKVLGDEAIRTTGGGYALRLAADALDAAVFARAVAAARDGRDPAAFAAAEALWHGDALADVPGAWADRQRVRLQSERQAAVRERIALDLDQGRADAAVAELTSEVGAHPLDEGLRGLLMTALARSGRAALAVTHYQQIRALLAEELGLDPGPELQQTYRHLLDGTSAALVPAVTSPAPVVPAQLPAGIRDFVGRAEVLDRLTTVLTQAGGAAPVVGLVGLGGVGTSTLAIRLAHHVRACFPDGQLYADLREAGPAEVLGRFLRAFGVSCAEIPDDVTERAALWRSVVSGRRILLLLDHVPDTRQLTLLLPVTGGAAAIVTGSRRMPDLAVDEWISLPPFTPAESLALLGHVAGAERVRAEAAAAQQVAGMCSHIPIGVRLAAERLRARPQWTIADGADRLREELRQPVVVHDDCRRAYRPIERRLAEVRADEPLAAEAFVLAARADGPEAVLADVAGPLGLGELEAERLMEYLVDVHLLEPGGFRRYRYLDIVRRLAHREALALSA
jgi:DNA-binding SARP family transcriptional activator